MPSLCVTAIAFVLTVLVVLVTDQLRILCEIKYQSGNPQCLDFSRSCETFSRCLAVVMVRSVMFGGFFSLSINGAERIFHELQREETMSRDDPAASVTSLFLAREFSTRTHRSITASVPDIDSELVLIRESIMAC